jgi:hypothetical protein
MREQLADLARGTLRHKLPQLQQALRGQVQPHHQVLLGQIFAHISYLEHSIQQLQGEIEQRLCPFEEARQLLLGIPGMEADCRGGYSGGNWRGYESLSLGQASGAPSPGCVQATNKAEANVSQARPLRAMSACAPC